MRQTTSSRVGKEYYVDVIIERNVHGGHIAIGIDGYIYSFWPDLDQKHPVNNSTDEEQSASAIYGGYKGVFIKGTQDEFANRYSNLMDDYFLVATEKEKMKLIMPKLPYFEIFKIPLNFSKREKLLKLLEKNLHDPPEFSYNCRGTGINCVELTEIILKECGIIDMDFKIDDGYFTPIKFKDEMKKFQARNIQISLKTRRLSVRLLWSEN